MAIRTDITVDWYDSPRTVLIAQPSTSIVVQDLHDTLVGIQDTIEGSEFPDLIDSSGKGGGVTGIVTILQNAQVLFEPRTTVIEAGTVTTADAMGRDLIDSAATFVTNGVARGDMVVNKTDFSHATVLSVVSETQLRTLVLAGGGDNQYGIGDSYDIFDYVFASITGGDLFAVDDVGGDLTPILNSFGVFGPVVEQSTSPAAVPLQPDTVIELDSSGNPITAAQSLQILNSTLGARVSGVTTTTERFRDPANTKDRVVVTLDVNGNRTAVALNLD